MFPPASVTCDVPGRGDGVTWPTRRDDPCVHAFIVQAQWRYELLKEYPPRMIEVDAAVWAANFPTEAAIDEAFFLLSITQRALTDPCLCGGPARFGDCHAEEFGRRKPHRRGQAPFAGANSVWGVLRSSGARAFELWQPTDLVDLAAGV